MGTSTLQGSGRNCPGRDRFGVDIASTRGAIPPSLIHNSSASLQHKGVLGVSKSEETSLSKLFTRAQTKMTQEGTGYPSTHPYPSPPPSHIVRRAIVRLRRQKLVHRLSLTFFRSEMHRGISVLRRVEELRQEIPHSEKASAPPPAPAHPLGTTPPQGASE